MRARKEEYKDKDLEETYVYESIRQVGRDCSGDCCQYKIWLLSMKEGKGVCYQYMELFHVSNTG